MVFNGSMLEKKFAGYLSRENSGMTLKWLFVEGVSAVTLEKRNGDIRLTKSS